MHALLRQYISVLFGSQIIQRISRTLFVKEVDVILNLLLYRLIAGYMNIHEHLCFDPTVDGLHCGIVCRRTDTAHRMCDAVHWK